MYTFTETLLNTVLKCVNIIWTGAISCSILINQRHQILINIVTNVLLLIVS